MDKPRIYNKYGILQVKCAAPPPAQSHWSRAGRPPPSKRATWAGPSSPCGRSAWPSWHLGSKRWKEKIFREHSCERTEQDEYHETLLMREKGAELTASCSLSEFDFARSGASLQKKQKRDPQPLGHTHWDSRALTGYNKARRSSDYNTQSVILCSGHHYSTIS